MLLCLVFSCHLALLHLFFTLDVALKAFIEKFFFTGEYWFFLFLFDAFLCTTCIATVSLFCAGCLHLYLVLFFFSLALV